MVGIGELFRMESNVGQVLPRSGLVQFRLWKRFHSRKNSLFYLTENGAKAGDLFMSLIHTAELCGANPFDYLTQLQRHADELKENPSQWMPELRRRSSTCSRGHRLGIERS